MGSTNKTGVCLTVKETFGGPWPLEVTLLCTLVFLVFLSSSTLPLLSIVFLAFGHYKWLLSPCNEQSLFIIVTACDSQGRWGGGKVGSVPRTVFAAQ
jgi:hypothetical protein